MSVTDLWTKRDGSRSAAYGRGRRWRARWHDWSATFDSKREAVTAEAIARSRQPKPKVADVTVDLLLNRWIESKRGLSKSGRDGCHHSAAHVRETWRHTPASKVTRPAVREWLAGLDGSESTQIKAMQALSGALQIAVEEGVITVNPCDGVKRPKEKPAEAAYLTVGQVRKLADAAGDYGPLVWFLAATGLRPGEACALTVGDVDVRRKRVRVKSQQVGASKSDARDVPVPVEVLDMLDLDRAADAWLFLSPSGRRLNRHNWGQRHFRDATIAVGMIGVRPYDLRHTAVSLAIEADANVKVIQRMVGHRSAKLTLDRYGHLFDRSLDDVADRMGGLIRGDSGGDSGGDTP